MIDVLSDVWTGVFINMFLDEFAIGVRANVEVIMLVATVTDLELVVKVLYGVDMMADRRAESVIAVGLPNVLTAVMTVLEFTMPASLEESLVFD